MAKQDKSMTPEYILKSSTQQGLGKGEDLSKKTGLRSLAAALSQIEKEQQTTAEEKKTIVGSNLKSAVIPQLSSVSQLQEIQQPPQAIEASVSQESGRRNVLDSILTYSKISSDNSTLLVSLTQDIKNLHSKGIEDNKELLERLLKSNESLRTSMEENMREASRSARGAATGTSSGAAAAGQGGGAGGGGGGIPDWLKTAAGVAAGGLGAKMLGGASKVVGPKAASRAMAGAKGFGRGALKAGGLGALGLMAYTMSSEDLKQALSDYGIDEDAIAAAGLAGTLGYGAYKAKKGMEGVDDAIKQKKVDNIEAQKDSGKQAERVKEAKEAAKEAKAQPKAEAPKETPKVEAPKETPKVEAPKETPKVDPTKQAAEAAKDKITKQAGEEVTEKAGKTAGKEAVKKAITKSVTTKAVSSIAKKVPVIGAIAGLSYAIGRAMDGDYSGAAAEVTSGIIGGTGIGAVGSLAIDAGLMARDVYKEIYGTFPENDEPSVRTERMNEIQNEVSDYVKSLLPQQTETKDQPTLQPLDDMSGAPIPAPESPKIQPAPAPKFRSGAADVVPDQSSQTKSQISPETSQSIKSEVLAKTAPQGAGGPPIIVNKGGDTINNITNASGGGSGGGGPGSPSRIPNPYDTMVFGNPWAAYY